MNVTCPNCATIYRVDPAKVPEAGVRARCAVCSAIFPVARESAAGGTATAVEPGSERAPPPAPMPPAPKAAPAPPPAPVTPPASPASAPAPRGLPPRPATPPAPAAASSAPSAPPAPPAAPRSAPAPAMPPRPAAPPAAARRPVNPFLSQDPSQKARRLARALISDMVVYHPAKRREGIRDGTLKQLFEDEIKKSWEEYSEQVGRDVAESSSHFRDALNEILADGRSIF
jgi:predicted Zn finger-like uncharacterized protein